MSKACLFANLTGDPDYFQKVMDDEELLQSVCMQGSDAMQEWVRTVLEGHPGVGWLARPDEVAEALQHRTDLGASTNFARNLFSQCMLEPLYKKHCDLKQALDMVCDDVRRAGVDCLGYILSAGTG